MIDVYFSDINSIESIGCENLQKEVFVVMIKKHTDKTNSELWVEKRMWYRTLKFDPELSFLRLKKSNCTLRERYEWIDTYSELRELYTYKYNDRVWYNLPMFSTTIKIDNGKNNI